MENSKKKPLAIWQQKISGIRPYLFLTATIAGIAFVAFTGYKYILGSSLGKQATGWAATAKEPRESKMGANSVVKRNNPDSCRRETEKIIDYLMDETIDLETITNNY